MKKPKPSFPTPRTPSLKIGQLVRFYPSTVVRGFTVHRVRDLVPDGIPSCREPMVLLEGRAGVVLESHCDPILSPEELDAGEPEEGCLAHALKADTRASEAWKASYPNQYPVDDDAGRG